MPININSGFLLTRKPEDEKHGNHVRVPTIGIRDLRITASGQSSKFHLPENTIDPGPAAAGKDGFNFLPEHDTCELIFDLDNAFDIVDRARIEVYRRFDTNPLWELDLVQLGPTWIRHGKHTVKWAGQVFAASKPIAGTIKGEDTEHDLSAQKPALDPAANAPFPEGWLTLEHSPYKLRLVLESNLLPNNPAEAWTYFHVMLEKIEIKLGPEEAIPGGGAAATPDQKKLLAMEKAVRKQFEKNEDGTKASLPAPGATQKVYLVSNVFKNSGAEFAPTSSTDFSQYQTLWGDGPRIPLLAKLWMRAADGSAIELATAAKGAPALGRAKFLWDWQDPDEVATTPEAKAVTYIANSRNYDKSTTGPQGDNCHIDRGGARGPNAAAIFPDQAGYAPKKKLDAEVFPFAVGTALVDPKRRKWAAFSTGWTSGALKGHTGALFRPSRMAGDNYIVSVQLAHDCVKEGADLRFTIDVTDKDLKVPAAITAKTGTFEIWRRIELSRYVRKTTAVPAFSQFAGVANYYSKAQVDVKTAIPASDNYTMDRHKPTTGAWFSHNYNKACREELDNAGLGELYDERLIMTGNDDHASVTAVFKVCRYADFVKRVHILHHTHPAADFRQEGAAQAPAVSADVFASRLGALGAPLATAGPNAAVNSRRTRLNDTRAYLIANGLETLKKFSKTLEDLLKPPAKSVAINYPAINGCGPSKAKAKPGVVVLHWDFLHTGTQEFVNSGQPDHDGLRGAAIDSVERKRDTVVFALWRPLLSTFAHEIGHHLFLPHTQPPHSSAAALNVHDQTDTAAGKPLCLMSYNPNRHGFCGQCLLRLRGWDISALNPDSTQNKKP